MIVIEDELGHEPVFFRYCETREDIRQAVAFARSQSWHALDTESTGLNCYKPGWELRTFQFSDHRNSFVIPAQWRQAIRYILKMDGKKWIGHNGPHDIRCIDHWLGAETGVYCKGETYIPAHHHDSRNKKEGGVGNSLKEQAIRHVTRDAGKWEDELKKVFKSIEIPIPGEVYKSGPRRGTPKVRKAKLSEGWALIDPQHPAYIAYAAADPVLTYRLWQHYIPQVRRKLELYQFDLNVQLAADQLQRRAIKLDVPYTRKLDSAYARRADQLIDEAREYGLENLNSGAQIAEALIALCGEHVLSDRTEKGALITDSATLRKILANEEFAEGHRLIQCVLGAKQLLKRKASYTESMLEEADSDGRIHPSFNTLGARTARMSVSNPPLQQLPTKDREEDE